jgi:hypothetical protein
LHPDVTGLRVRCSSKATIGRENAACLPVWRPAQRTIQRQFRRQDPHCKRPHYQPRYKPFNHVPLPRKPRQYASGEMAPSRAAVPTVGSAQTLRINRTPRCQNIRFSLPHLPETDTKRRVQQMSGARKSPSVPICPGALRDLRFGSNVPPWSTEASDILFALG